MRKGVLITYTAIPSFLSSESWPKIHAALLSQLPLRNLHWKSASRPSIRTIQELEATLVPLDTLRDEHTSQVPVTLSEKPLLNIYIVTCEDSDLELYRSTVKRQIKDWLATVSQRKNQEWVILHIVRPEAKMPTANFFQLKGSVLDKIRADFSVEKRDRCVQLVWSATGSDNPAVWADLITKIKDGLLSAFDSAVSMREDEVKRSEGQRQMPGWNFCTFFILKESLALSFEGVNLFEDALQQYDELETSFYQVLREKNLSWFGTLITPSPEDDSLPLLSITKKPYRSLILANKISVFDFRIYLLARQCALLFKMGRVHEVSRKAGSFLGGFGRRLRDVDVDLPEFFVESWTYSSALSVADQCDIWAAERKPEDSTLASFYAGKGELLELALNQLDTLGIKVGHLPALPPFSTFAQQSSEASKDAWKRSSLKISKAELLSSLTNPDAFYDLYVNVTNRAIDMYTKSGRRKFALKLWGCLAALDVHRGRLSTAITTYTSLPAHYSPHDWTSIESFMLSRTLDTHAKLGRPKDREWVHTLLSFLRTYADDSGEHWLVDKDDKIAYVTDLVDMMKSAAQELVPDVVYSDHPAISFKTSTEAQIARVEDGAYLDITIQNHLPCALPVDEVKVVLAGRDAGKLEFESTISALEPGTTALRLFCPTSSHGIFVHDSSQVRMSHIVLQWNHRKGQKSRETKNYTLVRIPRDLRALNVQLSQPHRIELGTSSKLLLMIHTCRNHISTAILRLTPPIGMHFNHSGAILPNCGPRLEEATSDHIKIADLAADQSLAILVPYSGPSTLNDMKVTVNVEYVSDKRAITRTLITTQMVAISLPVAVNVQDYFRETRLFSRFTASTTTDRYVRIASAQLDTDGADLEGVQIVGCQTQQNSVIITPVQPANFLFYLESAHGPVRESLTLLLKYRLLQEEVESLIGATVEEAIRNQPSLSPYRDTLVSRLVSALQSNAIWEEHYRVTGELIIPDITMEDDNELCQTLATIRQKLREDNFLHFQDGEWQEFRIPVDVPRMTIVAAARITLSLPTSPDHPELPLYAGQPIPAILSIHTSFHWGVNAGDKESKYRMCFDVEEMVGDWLVSGRKRGDFTAKDGATFTASITLIALHHGEATLPKVAVTALPLVGEFTMGSLSVPTTETYQLHGAERVLVLPRGGRSTFAVRMGESPLEGHA